jgi:hypothetical protein
MDTITNIDLVVPGSPSLIMRDLADYTTLPFLAAFDVQIHPKNHQHQTPQKRVTYIALSKKTMPMLVELFLKFKSNVKIYTDGTLESILSVGILLCFCFTSEEAYLRIRIIRLIRYLSS